MRKHLTSSSYPVRINHEWGFDNFFKAINWVCWAVLGPLTDLLYPLYYNKFVNKWNPLPFISTTPKKGTHLWASLPVEALIGMPPPPPPLHQDRAWVKARKSHFPNDFFATMSNDVIHLIKDFRLFPLIIMMLILTIFSFWLCTDNARRKWTSVILRN